MLIGPSSASARATIRATASEPGDIRLDRNNAPASRRDFAGRCFRFRRAGRIVEANRRPLLRIALSQSLARYLASFRSRL